MEPLRIVFALIALVLGVRRFWSWRRTGIREELLRAGIMAAVFVLVVTNHRAAAVPLVILLAVFAWRRFGPKRGRGLPTGSTTRAGAVASARPLRAPDEDAASGDDTERDPDDALGDDWSAQERELRATFPDYERNVAASPNLVNPGPHRTRFRLAQAARWDVSPEGALELAAGWHEAEASLAFEHSPPGAEGLDVVRLRLTIDASGNACIVDVLLDGSRLLELALDAATPRAYLLRCPDAWRRALATELRVTNGRGLNDSREHVDFAIEGASVHVRLKYQAPRFDLAFLPPNQGPDAGELGADETRLLVVLRGVTAELAGEVETIPPLVCALRLETLLEPHDAVASDAGEIVSPRVTRGSR